MLHDLCISGSECIGDTYAVKLFGHGVGREGRGTMVMLEEMFSAISEYRCNTGMYLSPDITSPAPIVFTVNYDCMSSCLCLNIVNGIYRCLCMTF